MWNFFIFYLPDILRMCQYMGCAMDFYMRGKGTEGYVIFHVALQEEGVIKRHLIKDP